DLTSAFTLKGVRQVKGGITVIDGVELAIPHGAIIALAESPGRSGEWRDSVPGTTHHPLPRPGPPPQSGFCVSETGDVSRDGARQSPAGVSLRLWMITG